MRLFRLLAARRLRHQPLRTLLGVAAIAAGTSLSVAVTIVAGSFSESFADHGRAVAGPAPLRIAGATNQGGVRPEAVEAARTTAGVTAAVPVVRAVGLLQRPAAGPSEPVLVLGADCSVQHLVGDIGCDPLLLAAAGDVPLAVGPGVPEGATLRLGPAATPLDGLPRVGELGGLAGGRVVVYGLDAARRLLGRQDRVDAVFVALEPGARPADVRRRLQEAVGPHNTVVDAAEPAPELQVIVSSFVPLLALIGLFALGTGAVLVNNSLSLAVEERRRQLAVLAALGGTGRLVGGGLVLEAALVGLSGGVAGIAGGLAAARPIVSSLGSITSEVAGVPLQVHLRPAAVAMAALLGLLLGAGAAVLPTRRALRVDVAAELSGRAEAAEAAQPRLVRRLLVSVLAASAGVLGCWLSARGGALQPWQARLGPPALLLATTGLLFCAANAAPLVARLAARPAARAGVTARLAAVSLVREPRRTAVMATAVGAAVVTAFAASSYNRAVGQSLRRSIAGNLGGVLVSAIPNSGNDANLEAHLSGDQLRRIAEVPGVAALHRGVVVVAGARPSEVVGVVGYTNPWFDAAVLRGSIDMDRFSAGQAVIGPTLARERGLRPGDRLALPTPSGMVEVPVLAVHADGNFGGSNVTLPIDLVERLYGPRPPTGVIAAPAPGTDVDALAARIRAAGLGPVTVTTPDQAAADAAASVSSQLAPFWVLQRALMVVAFVAVLTTLLLVGVQRRRELATLAAIGQSPAGAARLVVGEGVAVALLGVAVALAVALPMLWSMLLVVPLLVGWRNDMAPDWAAFVAYGIAAVALGGLASLWPARTASRTDLAVALRYD